MFSEAKPVFSITYMAIAVFLQYLDLPIFLQVSLLNTSPEAAS